MSPKYGTLLTSLRVIGCVNYIEEGHEMSSKALENRDATKRYFHF